MPTQYMDSSSEIVVISSSSKIIVPEAITMTAPMTIDPITTAIALPTTILVAAKILKEVTESIPSHTQPG